jgi:hypothetical protein
LTEREFRSFGLVAFLQSINIRRIDQVRGQPAVEVVIVHKAVDELSDLIGVTVCDRDQQTLKPNHFVITCIVALVELVPSAELASHGVPEQVMQFDASTAS